MIEPVAREIERLLGDYVYSDEGEDLEGVVGRLLRESGRSVACAESLTGGSLGVRLSAAPGSSDFFRGSAVCYTAEAKQAVLGVSRETLEGPGVVSEECAVEMARGARRLYEADVAVALTGVAGPDAHGGKPPGTICVGLAADGVEVARTLRAPGKPRAGPPVGRAGGARRPAAAPGGRADPRAARSVHAGAERAASRRRRPLRPARDRGSEPRGRAPGEVAQAVRRRERPRRREGGCGRGARAVSRPDPRCPLDPAGRVARHAEVPGSDVAADGRAGQGSGGDGRGTGRAVRDAV